MFTSLSVALRVAVRVGSLRRRCKGAGGVGLRPHRSRKLSSRADLLLPWSEETSGSSPDTGHAHKHTMSHYLCSVLHLNWSHITINCSLTQFAGQLDSTTQQHLLNHRRKELQTNQRLKREIGLKNKNNYLSRANC